MKEYSPSVLIPVSKPLILTRASLTHVIVMYSPSLKAILRDSQEYFTSSTCSFFFSSFPGSVLMGSFLSSLAFVMVSDSFFSVSLFFSFSTSFVFSFSLTSSVFSLSCSVVFDVSDFDPSLVDSVLAAS